jgi:hypothetical protein
MKVPVKTKNAELVVLVEGCISTHFKKITST